MNGRRDRDTGREGTKDKKKKKIDRSQISLTVRHAPALSSCGNRVRGVHLDKGYVLLNKVNGLWREGL